MLQMNHSSTHAEAQLCRATQNILAAETRFQPSDYSKSIKYNSDKFWEGKVQGAVRIYNPVWQVRKSFLEEVIFKLRTKYRLWS